VLRRLHGEDGEYVRARVSRGARLVEVEENRVARAARDGARKDHMRIIAVLVCLHDVHAKVRM
jgi:hypothetical protein